MNKKKSVWDELKDLPRDTKSEEQSWVKIENKMVKPKHLYKAFLTVIVTVAMMGLMFTLLNTTQYVDKSIQGTSSNPTLEAIYFMKDSTFEEFKARNSVLYTYIHKNDKVEQLQDFQNYFMKSAKVDVPRPSTTYLNGLYSDVIFKYENGTEVKVKILESETGYFYNVEEKQWYLIRTKDVMELELLSNVINKVLTDNNITSWVPILLLINTIFTLVLEKILKRYYELEKIKYGGENKFAKTIIYANILGFGTFLISIILFEFIIHLFWILAIFIISIVINIYVENKYAQNKAALYMLISSSIGILLFTIFFSLNI